jgi:sugar phosphate isomerase/epimerase
MRLAVSSIAWPAGADGEARAILRQEGAGGVELALTKVWPEPLEASPAEVAHYRGEWEACGLPVVALQALLFGKPHLTLFGSPAARRAALDYLTGIIRQAGRLGAHALVFGSPGNRKRGSLDPAVAREVAVPFFRELGEVARGQGVTLCLEPNPPEYGCDFATTAAEAALVVDAVGSAGFGLHLDTGAMTLAGVRPPALRTAVGRCRHFHVSTPFLAGVPGGNVAHAEFAAALREEGYTGWVSIEMSEARLQPSWQEGVRRALAFTRATYAAAAGDAPAARAG